MSLEAQNQTPPIDAVAKAREIFQSQQQQAHVRTDRMFACAMVVQWLAAIAVAYWCSPHGGLNVFGRTYPYLLATGCLGGILPLVSVVLVCLNPGAALTRHVLAVSQMLMSALLIYLSGGRDGTHFHVFGSLVFLAF